MKVITPLRYCGWLRDNCEKFADRVFHGMPLCEWHGNKLEEDSEEVEFVEEEDERND